MFTQSAFRRKNTPELREKLEKLGYGCKYSQTHADIICTGHNTGLYSAIIGDSHEWFKELDLWIDCSDNEPLFLAIAALRDDSDYMQWFTDGSNWELLEESFFDLRIWLQYHISVPWKASKEELINHFK